VLPPKHSGETSSIELSFILLHGSNLCDIEKPTNVSLLFFVLSCFNIALNNFICMVRMGFCYFRLLFVSFDEKFFSFLTGFVV